MNKKCTILLDGKECGLELLADETEEARLIGLHRCPLGHRVYTGPSKATSDAAKPAASSDQSNS
jgi:hypothetical protein